MVVWDLLHELVLRESFGIVIHGKALRLEIADGSLANIFQKEEFQALVVNRMQHLWLPNCSHD